MRIRLFFLSLILWIIGSPAAGGSRVPPESPSCEAILAPQVQIYVSLVGTALQAKIISDQDLAKLTVDNLNPLQGKELTHQNVAIYQGLAKTIETLSAEAKQMALVQIANIRGVVGSDAEASLKGKHNTENIFAPILDQKIGGMLPNLRGHSVHNQIFLHQDDAGDWLIVADQTRLHVVNLQDPSQRRLIDGLPLMSHPKGLTSRDGKFYLAFISEGGAFVFDLSSEIIAEAKADQSKVSNQGNVEDIRFVEDKSGRRYLLATYGASQSTLRVYEHTSELKLRSEVSSSEWRSRVPIMFGPTGGIFLAHYSMVLNEDDVFEYYVEVIDLAENKIVQRWSVDNLISTVIGTVRSDGSFALAATRNSAGSPILFFQTGSNEIKASAIFTFHESVPRWFETKDGRLLFSIYGNGQTVGTFDFHIFEPFAPAPPAGKIARFMKMFKKRAIQMVSPLYSSPRKADSGTSDWIGTYASNESFWMRLGDDDMYVEANDNKIQRFVWQGQSLAAIGNPAPLTTQRSFVEGGLSVFDPQTSAMYAVFGNNVTTVDSVWWSSNGLVKRSVLAHDSSLKALAISRTGEVIFAVAESPPPSATTKNVLIYKLTRPSERQEP